MKPLHKMLLLLLGLLALWGVIVTVKPSVLSSFYHNLSFFQNKSSQLPFQQGVKILSEESVTVDTVKKVGPSVVTIIGTGPATTQQEQLFPFDPFGTFNLQVPFQPQPQQSVGSGYILNSAGLIVTNKHVVSDTSETYQVITAYNKKYSVKNIYRDPDNDIAIIKIDPSENLGTTLTPVVLGDSSHLEVGQFVVAIGTALGEFKNTVTTGVISGLGRGITAGDEFAGSVENLSNVIQTSSAINPGNSGGPLVNSSGQVIGMNTAVAQNGQNIGFAIPINTIKDAINNFNENGQQFSRPFLGVSYRNISQSLALLNNVPQGAYVASVVAGSPAEKAGIQQGDIILKVDGTRVDDKNNQVAALISHKKVGQSVTINLWRDNKTMDVTVTLSDAGKSG
ncbi:MAG TPA: trypsin-like peptidase domain-containing protein [Patescibacteria group bacterium]|nr:trypsin-like peptidase domain-containing protein [Patescibacteria group bacterium]